MKTTTTIQVHRSCFGGWRSGGAALCLGLLMLAGCGGGGGGGGGSVLFVVRNAKKATAPSSPVEMAGKWLVYLADEATSQTSGAPTNLNAANGDLDTADAIAVLIDMSTQAETSLNVAARSAVIAGNQVYLVVEESEDSFDWDGDGSADDLVLLHVGGPSGTPSPASVNTEFVDTLESADVPAIVASGRVYYSRDDSVTLAAGETSLSYLEQTAPITPVTVLQLGPLTTLRPRIHSVDENLLFLYADEVVEARDLNNDTDTTDLFVLALLEATDATAKVHGVGLALADDDAPVKAQNVAAGDWIVGFLVNEAAQNDFPTGLNDPALFAPGWSTNCTGDTDIADDVLHYLSFALWDGAPAVNPPVNTGLAGDDRILIVGQSLATGSLATVVKESEDGPCDLNADGDTSDEVLRWVRTTTPVMLYGNAAQLVAIDDNIAGGARGISDLDNRLLATVDEAQDERDHDGDGSQTHKLLAWLDPASATPVWTYDHNDTTSFAYFEPTWLGDRLERDKLLVAFRESVYGTDVFGTDINGDGDKVDSIPAFSDFDPSNTNDLDFAWHANAADALNAGLAIGNGVLFYRIDEASDGNEWGGAGLNDKILFRSPLANVALASNMGVLNSLSPSPSVINKDNSGAAYICEEAAIGLDLNGDGDQTDFVLRWFRIG